MQRDIFSCSFASHLRGKLIRSGYVTVGDFEGTTVEKLSTDAEINPVEAIHVLTSLGITADREELRLERQPVRASDHSQQSSPIATFSQMLDGLLGGGVPLGRLTEVCGMPGSGKTQLCLQLSVNVQMPERFGGLAGEALYVDTDGSFSVERLSDMAEAVTKRFSAASPASDDSGDEQFSADGVLRGVHYYRCLDFAAFMGMVNVLPDFVADRPKVRLVVIDSVTYHFRHHFDSNYQLRTNLLQGVSSALTKLADERSLAVVVTNQMTTRMSRTDGSSIVPALGDNWSHACCNRLCLAYDDGRRRATLAKSSYVAASTAFFHIETAGIRDVPFQGASRRCSDYPGAPSCQDSTDTGGKQENAEDRPEVAAAKRPRLDSRNR